MLLSRWTGWNRKNIFDTSNFEVLKDIIPLIITFINCILQTIIYFINSQRECVIPVASTGLASSLIEDGRTVHSRFRLPIVLLNDSSSSLSEQSEEAQFIRRAKLIIWDEASMASKYAYEAVDRLLQMINHMEAPFGGKVILLYCFVFCY